MTIISLVIISSLLHSTWHSLVKISDNKLVTYAIINVFAGILAGFYLIYDGEIARESFSILIASIILHLIYKAVLIKAYEAKDFSIVFPISRGAAPLFIVFITALFLAEDVGSIKLVVIFAIGMLICLLAAPSLIKGEISSRNIMFAVLTGLVTACYSIIDGYGGRISGNPIAFICWMYVFDATVFPAYASIKHKNEMLSLIQKHFLKAFIAAFLSVVSYAIVVFAMSRMPISEVAAIREINIVFAAIISYFFLKERVTLYKFLIIVLITLCVSFLSYYR